MPATVTELRRDLAAAFVLADKFGFSEGICNHFSVVVPGAEERYLIDPYGVHWSEMKPHHLLLIDGAGRIVEGDGEVESTALYIHVAGHRANPRHRAILHVRTPYATALTMLEGARLEMAHQTAVRFHGRMTRLGFGGIALDGDEGERIVEDHGVSIGGESVAIAFDDLYYLERACRQQLIAQSSGLPLKILPDETIAETRRQIEQIRAPSAQQHFTALMRANGLTS